MFRTAYSSVLISAISKPKLPDVILSSGYAARTIGTWLGTAQLAPTCALVIAIIVVYHDLVGVWIRSTAIRVRWPTVSSAFISKLRAFVVLT